MAGNPGLLKQLSDVAGTKAKALLKAVFRAAVSIGLLLWLFRRVDVGSVFSSFGAIAPGVWCSAFALYLLSQVLSSIRWSILARALGFSGRMITYLKFYFVGMFFSLFLPSAIGGDVLKTFFLARGEKKKLKAGYSILCDRLVGLWAMFLLGAGAVIISPQELPRRFGAMLLITACAMTFGVLGMPLVKKMLAIFFPVLSERLDSMLVYWSHPRVIASALTLSLMLQFCGMYAVYLLGHGLGLPCTPEFYFSSFPLVALLTILPISLSGLGIREGGFVYFMGLKHVPPEKAITLSLGFFAVQAAAALLGGIGFLAGVHREGPKDA